MLRSDKFRQPDPGKKNNLRGKEASSRNPGLNKDNGREPSTERRETADRPNGEHRREVTNQDEQRKVVNTDNTSPLGEQESEGT